MAIPSLSLPPVICSSSKAPCSETFHNIPNSNQGPHYQMHESMGEHFSFTSLQPQSSFLDYFPVNLMVGITPEAACLESRLSWFLAHAVFFHPGTSPPHIQPQGHCFNPLAWLLPASPCLWKPSQAESKVTGHHATCY